MAGPSFLYGYNLGSSCRISSASSLRALDLNQRALADPRAIVSRLRPLPRTVHQLGPEWENPALGRLRRMNPAAPIVQEVAVRSARHAEPHTVGRPVNILALESGRSHPDEPGGAHQICLRQVDEPLLPAALGTPWLAFKPDFLRHPAPLRIIIMCDTMCNASAFVIYFLLSIGEGVYVPCQRHRVST